MNDWLQARRDDLVWWWHVEHGKAKALVAGMFLATFIVCVLVGVGGRALFGLPL